MGLTWIKCPSELPLMICPRGMTELKYILSIVFIRSKYLKEKMHISCMWTFQTLNEMTSQESSGMIVIHLCKEHHIFFVLVRLYFINFQIGGHVFKRNSYMPKFGVTKKNYNLYLWKWSFAHITSTTKTKI